MKRLLLVLRSIAAVAGGYAVIMVCTIVGFKPLGVIVRVDAPLRTQFLGCLVAIVSGLLGGAAAAGIAGRAPVRHAPRCWHFSSPTPPSCCHGRAKDRSGSIS